MKPRIVTPVLVLFLALLPAQLYAAPELVPLKAGPMNALELESLEPFSESFVISGSSEHEGKVLHRGELVVSLYAARPALLDIRYPFPYDEYVWVLDGELILTHEDGRSESYGVGDMLLVPKGFQGTWEMRGDYRELVVIETRAYDSETSFWKFLGSTIKSWFRTSREMLSLPPDELREAELTPAAPSAADLELTGSDWEGVGSKNLYEGEFVAAMYSSPPTVVEFQRPFPYDEYVWMLDGELVLTPKGGKPMSFGPGEGVLVPKGFVGSWETRGSFREFIIIEREALERTDGS